MAKARALLITCCVWLLSSCAMTQEKLPYPDVADVSHAEPEAVSYFRNHFTLKTNKKLEEALATFSPEFLTFTDTTVGWPLDGFESIKKSWTMYMPKWGNGKSYPTRIVGGPRNGKGSGVVFLTGTPELFGAEIRSAASVDFKDGKLVRWVSYWDSTNFQDDLFKKLVAPADKFPSELKESQVRNNASERIVAVATSLHRAMESGKAAESAAHFSYDAIYEDLALRTQIRGRLAIEKFLGKSLSAAPYGVGSKVRHIVGSDQGGGFEWIAPAGDAARFGITSIELDDEGKVVRMSTMYDSRRLGKARADSLRALAAE